jgi:hypothetical protein
MSKAEIINAVGDQVWKIIDKSDSVMTVATMVANAIPAGADAAAMAAQGPNSKMVKYSQDWEFIVDRTTEVNLQVNWTYGAKHNGGGAYIPSVWVTVNYLNAAFNNDVDVSMQAYAPSNVGTDTAPIAYLPLSFTFKEDSTIPGEDNYETYSLGLYGTGHAQRL